MWHFQNKFYNQLADLLCEIPTVCIDNKPLTKSEVHWITMKIIKSCDELKLFVYNCDNKLSIMFLTRTLLDLNPSYTMKLNWRFSLYILKALLIPQHKGFIRGTGNNSIVGYDIKILDKNFGKKMWCCCGTS